MLTHLVSSTNCKAPHHVICSARRPCPVSSQSMCTLWWTFQQQNRFPSARSLSSHQTPSTYQKCVIILATGSVVKQQDPGPSVSAVTTRTAHNIRVHKFSSHLPVNRPCLRTQTSRLIQLKRTGPAWCEHHASYTNAMSVKSFRLFKLSVHAVTTQLKYLPDCMIDMSRSHSVHPDRCTLWNATGAGLSPN